MKPTHYTDVQETYNIREKEMYDGSMGAGSRVSKELLKDRGYIVLLTYPSLLRSLYNNNASFVCFCRK